VKKDAILIDANDAALVGKLNGLIQSGEVRPVFGLSKGESNHGREYALLRLHETQLQRDRLLAERKAVDAELETVATKLAGSEVVTAAELERYNASRRKTPPREVSKYDVKAVGQWSESIAAGKTKVR